MNNSLNILNHKIIKCTKCDRLVKFRKKITIEKKNNLFMKPIGENQSQVMAIPKHNYY
jgi:hypothetical protein